MKANTEGKLEGARWIRPAEVTPEGRSARISTETGVDELAGLILLETRRRVSALAALERDLEEKIRSRWNDAEVEIRRRIASAEEEVEEGGRRAEGEAREAKLRAEKEGRTSGFREGFARGREEGYRLGVEEGRRDGLQDGEREGREEASRRVEGDLSGAASALVEAAARLGAETERIAREARENIPRLAVEIARKVLKTEDLVEGDAIVRNVEKALELIFRRGAIAIQVHPDDAPAVERALAAEPLWAEGLDAVEVRTAPDVSRGGCRLLSGAGTVDMTLETQIGLIEAALAGALEDPALAPDLPSRSGEPPPGWKGDGA